MKRIIILFFLCCTIPLIAQHTDPIQEAMANYDYETADRKSTRLNSSHANESRMPSSA